MTILILIYLYQVSIFKKWLIQLTFNICVGAWTSSFFLGNFIGPSVAGFTVQHFGFAITTNGFVAAFVVMLLVNFIEWKQTYSRIQ